MPKNDPCECQTCQEWRKENLPFGSIYHSNLTTQSREALLKKNEPKGKRAARRKARGL